MDDAATFIEAINTTTIPAAPDPDPPEDHTKHPMWETQVALERGMLREGRDAFEASVINARERGQMTRLQPIRGLITDWMPPIADHLKEWVRIWQGKPGNAGPKPLALDTLARIDPYVAVLIALRETLDGLDTGRVNVTGLAREIGRTVEHEMQVRKWEDSCPDLFYTAQKHLKDIQATTAHVRRFNINQFNDMMRKNMFDFGWDKWGEELHFRVGIELLNAIVRVTGWFEFTPDPSIVARKKMSAPYVLTPKPNIITWLNKTLKHKSLTLPAFKPTVIPPRHWDGTRSGGYWTPYIKTPRLIRFKANQQDQQERAADEYEAIAMPQVYDALHFLQEVPWRINKRVHAVLTKVDAEGLSIAGIQTHGGELRPMDKPIHPVGFIPDKGYKGNRWEHVDREAERSWRAAASAVYKHNATMVAKSRGLNRTKAIADEYVGFERFYFPHMLDFRGRAYPIPVALQPQGADLARGLLEFADGKPIETREDADWLMIQLASTWGWDKLSMDERITRVDANDALWRRIAEDPIGNQEWAKQDKPWQALAAIFEWVALLDHGYGYMSHLVVSVDGTCNGIQHLSAMTRDKVAGEYVNLVPGEVPKDIYKHVAEALQETLERIEEQGLDAVGMEQSLPSQHASYWLNLCNRELPRKLTKRQVMVLPYGGTRDSYIKYTRDWLDEHDPVIGRPSKEQADLRFQRILFLVNHMWEAVNRTIPGAVVVMGWLRDCARIASVGNQPIFWQTASGFVVRHFYGAQKARQIRVMLDDVSAQLQMPQTTKDLDIQSQLRGISPNFVHSQDAAALILCINAAQADGITAFSAVHDAFGSHAASMGALGRHLREAFVEVHSVSVLETYRNACLAVMTAELSSSQNLDPFDAAQLADEKLPPIPSMGSLELDGVLQSDYFFA